MGFIRSMTRRMVCWLGWDVEKINPVFTSTRQASILQPIRVAAGLREDEGPLMFWSSTTGAPVWHSPHHAYRKGVTSSPNGVAVGDTSQGKSSLNKTLVERLIEDEGRGTVFDRKKQQGEGYSSHGEYERLAASVPSTTLVLDRTPGRGVIINILDPRIAQVDDEDTHAGQDELLRLAAEVALNRSLNQQENTALSAAHQQAITSASGEDRVPVLSDVVTALYTLSTSSAPGPLREGKPVLEHLGLVGESTMVEWGLNVALALDRFIHGDLSGLIEGETRGPHGDPLDLSAPLIICDTTALPQGSTSLGLMQLVVISFLESQWMSLPGDKIIIVEEAYSDEDVPRVARMLKRSSKRARGTGTMILSAYHHLSDVQPGSDLWSLIKETGVQYLFRQSSPKDAEAVCDFWDLDKDTYVPILTSLPKGCLLLCLGSNPPELVQHLRTEREIWITDTDAALHSIQKVSVA